MHLFSEILIEKAILDHLLTFFENLPVLEEVAFLVVPNLSLLHDGAFLAPRQSRCQVTITSFQGQNHCKKQG